MRNNKWGYFCGAALIGPSLVVSAAHCFKGITNLSEITVKYRPGVNFINILRVHCAKVRSKPNYKQRKAAQKTFVRKTGA